MVFSKRTLLASEVRDLQKIMSDFDDFTCGCDISEDLTEVLKVKGVSMNRNMTCSSPIEAFYYRSTNFEPICALCSKPLNEDLKKRLASKKETHSMVQTHCGEHGRLIRNVGGEDGWTALHPIAKKRKPKLKLKSKTKTQIQKRDKNRRLSLGEEKNGRRLKQTALKIPSCFYSL